MSSETPEDEIEETELQFLLDLYLRIGTRLCEHLGHDWDTVSDGTHTFQFDRCSRCEETRDTPTHSTTLDD